MTEVIAAPDLHAEVEREQWSLLLDNVRASTLPTALVGALFAAFFTHYAGLPQTWWWWGALLALLLLRSAVTRRLRAGPLPPSVAGSGLLHVVMFSLGTLWGVAPVIMARLVDDVMMFTALLLASGMAITAFGTYGIRPSVAIAFTGPVGLLSLVVIAATGDPTYYAVGVALLLLYAHQFVVMRQARNVLQTQIRLRVENSVLAAQLGGEAERTNAELDRRLETERILRASRDRAERLSATDALTEIANRRYFDKRLKSEVSRAFRERSRLSLVICDIDYFKQFNDVYGHQQGDQCLRTFSRTLESFCRRGGDLAARIGGEEFALLLPNTDHAAAMRLAEQSRAAFDALAIAHVGSKAAPNATASFGVSTLIPENLEAGELLVSNADRALYRAKDLGRNRVASEFETTEPVT